jgi:hypothetical protein
VIVISNSKEFKGLQGLERLDGFHNVKHSTSHVKPNPATWIKTAAVSWLKTNDNVDVPNLIDSTMHYKNTDSKEL